MRQQSEEEQVLAAELASCMLSHYKYCAAGVLVGLPLSIHKKSYWPVVMAAAVGTAADYKEGSANCRRQREALMACVARKNAEEAAKMQHAPPPASTTEDFMHNPPQEAWQADRQQDWPEKGREQNFDGNSVDQEAERGGKKW